MLTWNEQLVTGSELVDAQHLQLVEKLNAMEQILEGPLPPKSVCDAFLADLGADVASHFSYEEGCMERARCPAHAQNKRAHEAFLELFGRFRARYDLEGPSRELLTTLQRAASEWTVNHILAVDVQLRGCRG